MLRSPYLPSPCLAGIRRPVVLLPEIELSLSIRDVLIHELAHLVRRDCHWNLLRLAALSVFFFQPLLWSPVAPVGNGRRRSLRRLRRAIRRRSHEYAYRLVDIAELATASVSAAGVGIVSLRSMLARRVQRIMDTSRSLSTRVGSLLLALVLVGGLFGTLIVGLVGIGPRPAVEAAATDDGKTAEPDSAADDDDAPIAISGRIFDPAGNSVPGATVRLVRWYWDPAIEHKPLAETVSDKEGRFEISYRKSQFNVDIARPEQWKEVAVAAFKAGYGPDWVWANDFAADDKIELRLPADDLPVTGRLVNLEGQPLAGVKVECGELSMPKGKDLSSWVDAVRSGEPPSTAVRHLRECTGAGRDRTGAGLHRLRRPVPAFRHRPRAKDQAGIFGSAGSRTEAAVLTRPMEPLSQRKSTGPGDHEMSPVVGADFEITLPPTRIIEGVVRDAKTGEVLAGVGIRNRATTAPHR